MNEVEKGRQKSKVAEDFQIPASTLSTILSNRAETEAAARLGPNRKRARTCKNDEFDKRTFHWLIQARAANKPVTGPILQQQARQEALTMGINNFEASNGWLHKFKGRWNLTTLKMTGEEPAVYSRGHGIVQ